MFDTRPTRPAQIIEDDAETIEEETIPALELDPEEDQPLTDTAAADGPEVEPILGD